VRSRQRGEVQGDAFRGGRQGGDAAVFTPANEVPPVGGIGAEGGRGLAARAKAGPGAPGPVYVSKHLQIARVTGSRHRATLRCRPKNLLETVG
jgi:hypothetical protein